MSEWLFREKVCYRGEGREGLQIPELLSLTARPAVRGFLIEIS